MNENFVWKFSTETFKWPFKFGKHRPRKSVSAVAHKLIEQYAKGKLSPFAPHCMYFVLHGLLFSIHFHESKINISCKFVPERSIVTYFDKNTKMPEHTEFFGFILEGCNLLLAHITHAC